MQVNQKNCKIEHEFLVYLHNFPKIFTALTKKIVRKFKRVDVLKMTLIFIIIIILLNVFPHEKNFDWYHLDFSFLN